MTDAGDSIQLELELSGQETDQELEIALRENLPQILAACGKTVAESAWGRGRESSAPADGKTEFVSLMQQDYVKSTTTEDQEALLQEILTQAKQHRDALRAS